jgi:CDP-diglyceride synthetase
LTKLRSFKSRSRRIVIELIVIVALVSANLHFPKDESSSKAWNFVAHHPLLLLHAIVGTVVICEAITFLVRVSRQRNRAWIILASVGLAFVLIAYVTGENYVSTQRSSSLNDMSLAWFGAIVTYGVGWYWGHKSAKVSIVSETSAPSPTKVA